MSIKIILGDCREKLREMPAESVHCVVTSPPYWGLRDYGVDGMIGLEQSFDAFLSAMVEVFREVRRVLRKDGVLWLNMGDAYAQSGTGAGQDNSTASNGKPVPGFRQSGYLNQSNPRTTGNGLKPKDLMMQPARLALALQEDGWYLRSMMPWLKRSAMPESVTDRPATAIEYVFLLTRSPRYFFDMEAVRPACSLTSHGSPNINPGRKSTILGQGDGKLGKWTAEDKANGRNFRNSDLFYTSLGPPHGLISADEPLALDVNPKGFAESHFATFPPKLIEPLIKAGTSEKGVCAECGAPWVRETEISYVPNKTGGAVSSRPTIKGAEGQGIGYRPEALLAKETKTLGWSPSCQCNSQVGPPATILDPFGGAGTTGLVAERLGRNAILIELNPEYASMARSRISGDAPLFAEVT